MTQVMNKLIDFINICTVPERLVIVCCFGILVQMTILIFSKSRYIYIQFIIEYIGIIVVHFISTYIFVNDAISGALFGMLNGLSVYFIFCIDKVYKDLKIYYTALDKVDEKVKEKKEENKNEEN